jgi:hypothetical protein
VLESTLVPHKASVNVLDTADGHARQVHLDHGLLDGRLAAAVALDDLGLEGEFAEPWHLQIDLADPRLQLARVAAGTGIDAVGAALVALGAAKVVGLGVEQGVEGLLDRGADDAVEVLLELALVDAQDVGQRRALRRGRGRRARGFRHNSDLLFRAGPGPRWGGQRRQGVRLLCGGGRQVSWGHVVHSPQP